MSHCPVCSKEHTGLLCPSCGFDSSCHYEQYPTLGFIDKTTAVSQLAAAWNKRNDTLFRCPDCGNIQFFLDFQNSRYICANCQRRFPLKLAGRPQKEEPFFRSTDKKATQTSPPVKTASTQEILDKYLSGDLQKKSKPAATKSPVRKQETPFFVKKADNVPPTVKTASTQEILDKYLSGQSSGKKHP